MKRIINIIMLAVLANLYVAIARDYIVVLKDGTTMNEMENVMAIMCEMSPEECSVGGNNLRNTSRLMHTITGPMSDMAVYMAQQMSCVRYIEEDQIVTRADAVVDIFPPTTHPVIDPELPFIYDPRQTQFSAATATDSCNTDRYNLDIIDEDCYGCNNCKYEPESSGAGTDIYILDTGIRYDHSEFGGRAAYGGYDAVDDLRGENRFGSDCHGHGTHCAGIAGGSVSGVARDANLYSVRVLDCNSFGSFSGIVRALDHVYARHMEKRNLPTTEYKGSVVSMSLTGPGAQAMNEAVCRLVSAGVVVVTASGNFRRDACNYSPGSAGCHINVGAHYYTERETDTCIKDVFWFSSSSTSPGFNYGRCVHMMAPGQYVVSASFHGTDRHVSMSGTSMACPHVAGAAAIHLDQNPRMSPERVRALLRADSCPDIDERRMHSSLRGLTPNTRLRVLRRREEPLTTTIPTTTPPTTTPAPTSPPLPRCGVCAFDSLRDSSAEEVAFDSYEVTRNFITTGLYFILDNNLRFKRRIPIKISITDLLGSDEVLYSMIFKKVENTGNFVYLFNNDGVQYQDIDEEIATLNTETQQTCYPKTIIPVGDNRVYVLADCDSSCNDNEFRQANYTQLPQQISNPFTIDNLLGTKATFDISLTPNKNQVYVHNTAKTSPTCECYNYYNVEKSDLATFSESIGRGRKLVVQDIDALYYNEQLSFTVSLCMPDCYVGSGCVSEVVNNPVLVDLTRSDLDTMVESVRRLEWEPIALAGYYNGDVVHYAVSFIRVR